MTLPSHAPWDRTESARAKPFCGNSPISALLAGTPAHRGFLSSVLSGELRRDLRPRLAILKRSQRDVEIEFRHLVSEAHNQFAETVVRRLRRRWVNLCDIKDGMPRGANLGGQIPAVLVQRRGLAADGDLGVRHHAPDALHRLFGAY